DAATEIACASPADAPHQRAIPGIELLHALVGLDHLRPAHAHADVLRRDDAAATGSDDAATTKGPGATADQGEDRNAGAAHLDQGVNDLGDRQFAGICLLKPHATSVE